MICRYIGKKHLQKAMHHVLSKPLNTDSNSPQLAFAVLRVPFFLEPDYDESKPFIESNRERLVKKWGGKRGWEEQKRRHEYVYHNVLSFTIVFLSNFILPFPTINHIFHFSLKGRGMAAGIPHFNLDRLASNSMASHRLIQHIGKRYSLNVSEALYDRLNV